MIDCGYRRAKDSRKNKLELRNLFGARGAKHATHFSCDVPVIGGCVLVDRCTSIVGFAFWTVIGVEACPDLPCWDTVPPQLPLLIILSLV